MPFRQSGPVAPECDTASKPPQCISNDFVNKDSHDYVHVAGKEQVGVAEILSDLDKLEPIAIVGMSLRLPQDAKCTESFWEMLMEKRSAMTEVPGHRFNVGKFYEPGEKRTGMLNVKGGHFIEEDVAGFDAPFFSMTPGEAECVDPQQRWLLETAYEAFENAGIPIEQISGSKTSVHIGSFIRDYELMLMRDPDMPAPYKATGCASAMLANRLSWFYNLTGPSLALDSACSSSLTALHIACQGIRSGECTMGLVGGCNLIFNPEWSASLGDMGFLSPDGRSYSFDHKANGYSRGEGFCIVLVKTLAMAIQDGNTVRAVIRATSSNQDGRTPVICQPSSRAHEDMIRDAYIKADLDTSETRFFEAHGTGTPVGDPLEAKAINAVFGPQRSKSEPLYVGSVKSSIGHTEGASGLAGLIKTVLVLEKAVIPPNALYEKPNSLIPLNDWNIEFPYYPIPWPTQGLRRASVSSFGFGGANTHAVLEDAFNFLRLRNLQGKHRSRKIPPNLLDLRSLPLSKCQRAEGQPSSIQPTSNKFNPKLFVWSAFDEAALKRMLGLYQRHILHNAAAFDEEGFMNDLAFTLSQRRSNMPSRAYVVARSRDDLLKQLNPDILQLKRALRIPKLGFIFTGQGAHWPSMGTELMQFPIYKQSIQSAECHLRSLGCQWSVMDEISRSKESSNLDDPIYCQPICTVLQIALVDLLASWGVLPTLVVGHSSGEIAAAYCMGAISRQSAWSLSYHRGTVAALLKKHSNEPLAMMVVGLSGSDIEPFFEGTRSVGGTVAVACHNSPQSVTISGCRRRIDAVQKALQTKNVFSRILKVDVAYHTAYMNEVMPQYKELIHSIQKPEPQLDKVEMISSVTGKKISSESLRQVDYWVDNMTSPVLFAQTVQSALAMDKASGISNTVNHLVEIGPHAVLQAPVKQSWKCVRQNDSLGYCSILIRGRPASETILEALGQLFCFGYSLDLAKIHQSSTNPVEGNLLIDLPSYPWNHAKKYWLESRISKSYRFRHAPHNDLLGTPVSDWNPLEMRWRNLVRISENPWMKDHKVDGIIVYPAAGMLVMAIEATQQTSEPGKKVAGFRFRDVAIRKALTIPPLGEVETQFYLRTTKHVNDNLLHWNSFRICSCEGEDWAELCSGEVAVEYAKNAEDHEGLAEELHSQVECSQEYERGSRSCTKRANVEDFYDHLEKLGLSYGPAFQTLRHIRYSGEGGAAVSVNLRDWKKCLVVTRQHGAHVIHPAALDAIFQSVFPALTKGGTEALATFVPTRFRRLWISAGIPGSEDADTKVFAQTDFVGFRSTNSSVRAIVAATEKACVVGEFEMTLISGKDRLLGSIVEPNRLCYRLGLKPDFTLLSPKQIQSYCSSGLEVNLSEQEIKQKNDKILVCYSALIRLLTQRPQGNVLRKSPHLERYFDWSEHVLSSYENLGLSGPKARWTALSEEAECPPELVSEVEKLDPEGRVISLVARNLPDVMSGKVDALDLLFRDGAVMERFYHFMHGNSSALAKIQRYLDAFAHKNPNIKILEIGAGTGGATEVILAALARQGSLGSASYRFKEYVYTDISSSFFEGARDKFRKAQDWMTFGTLNIEQEPLSQGYTEAEFDLIIASQVLHATRDVVKTLRNTRKLLKRGGKLVLFETITPEAILPGFISGLLPGWWLGGEDNRRWGPLLNESDWSRCLSQSGFSGVDIRLWDHEPGLAAMISTATDCENKDPLIFETFIITMGSSVEGSIASLLQDRFLVLYSVTCKVVHVLDCELIDFRRSICIFLPEIRQHFLHQITEAAFLSMRKLVSTCHGVIWVTNERADEPNSQLVQGFARCIREEFKGLRLVTLSLDVTKGSASIVEKILLIYRDTMLDGSDIYEREYVERNDMLSINRMVEADHIDLHIHSRTITQPPKLQHLHPDPLRPLVLSIGTPGMLDTLEFREEPRMTSQLQDEDIEIEVKASGVNFRDVLIGLGQITGNRIGGECAGVVIKAKPGIPFRPGDRVISFIAGSFTTVARGKALTTCKIPDAVSLASAAAIPTIFCTAHYALSHWARMKPGETILIHSAAGGFGQATIQLAKLYGAEIYATVGSKEKRQFLYDTYGIPKDHMFSSRSDSFAKGISRMTNARGVDVVVNSLAGEALRTTWECVAPFGRFIEVGKKDVFNSGNLPMRHFAKNVTFACVDLEHIVQTDMKLAGTLLEDVMELLRAGKIAIPTPLHIYNASKVEDAFRYMQSGKSIGKVVIQFNQEDLVPTIPSMHHSWHFDSKASYLISGGLGGLGRCTARWMASRRAKNLILLSRHGAESEPARELVDELRSQGVTVAAPPCDVAVRDAVELVLSECNKTMPPIKGCIVGAMALKDAAFETMTHSDFQIAVMPKVIGTQNLHSLLPSSLDFFVCLSSASSIIGIPGQSNYAAGNSYQDALARYRVAAGKKAVSLDLGTILSVGYVSEHVGSRKFLQSKGIMDIREVEYLALLDYYCDPRLPILPPEECQIVVGIRMPGEPQAKGFPKACNIQTPLFRHLHQVKSHACRESATKLKKPVADMEQQLGVAKSSVQAAGLVLEALISKISRLVDVEKCHIDAARPLHKYGIDSLSAVEIRSWLRRDLDADIASFEILGDSSIAELVGIVVKKSGYIMSSLKT